MSIITDPTLGRTTFRTSRLLDFWSRKELIAQTGLREEQWPLVTLKELADDALDACEDVGITPVVLPGAGSDRGSIRHRRNEGSTREAELRQIQMPFKFRGGLRADDHTASLPHR